MNSFNDSSRSDDLRRFARRHGRDYMMRSEKRAAYSSSSGGRKSGRGRRRGGFFYSLLTLLLSVLIWPIGMILLWRRRLNWSVSTKLLTTIITLFICITMVGYGLTVQTDNAQITKVQDTVNDFLDNSADYIGSGAAAVSNGASQVWDTATDLADAAGRAAMVSAADVIDQGVTLAEDARESISGLLSSDDDDEDEAAEPTAEPTEAASLEPTEVPADVVVAVAVPPTTDPDATFGPDADDENPLPLTLPDETPDPESAVDLADGMLYADDKFAEAITYAEPTETHAPTE